MTRPTFVKSYRDPLRAAAARAHHAWLSSLDSGVRFPALHRAERHQLAFEHLGHRRPGPEHLAELARTLGLVHAAAYTRQLHAARPDQALTTSTSLVIADFVSPRRAMLARTPVPYLGLPVALYKDANIRNFVITDDGPAVVDFDDLTLAPWGFDLAKLVVSTAMTYGRLTTAAINDALAAYNAAAGGVACPPEALRCYAEFHHVATARYLHHNGYHHDWADVRPWPRPEPTDSDHLPSSSTRLQPGAPTSPINWSGSCG